jgi:AAA domain
MDPNVIDLQRWRDFNDAPAQPEDEPFMHLDPEPTQTAVFFEVVFGYLEGFIPLRGFIDKGQGAEGKPHNAWIPADADAAFNAAAFARWAAKDGAAFYVIPGTVRAHGQARAADVAEMQTVLVDLDCGDVNAKLHHLIRHLGQPTLIVESGGRTHEGFDKLHVWWKLTEPASGDDIELICRLRHQIALKVGGDTHFRSAHQPIRVAGSVYHKQGFRRLVAIREHQEVEHDLGELAERIEAMPAMPGAAWDSRPATDGKPSVNDVLVTPVREGAQDAWTRFQGASAAIGHYVRMAHDGRVTRDEAWQAICEYNAAMLRPPWPLERLAAEADRLWRLHVDRNGPALERIDVSADALPAFSFGEYLDDQSPMPADIIAPRLLTPGGLVVLGGAPKVGKSDFVISLLAHAAAGVPFLGFAPPRPLRVFYLQAEIQHHYLRERFQSTRLPAAVLAAARDNLVATPKVKMLLDANGVARTVEAIQTRFPDEPPDVICIDPIRNLFDGGPEDSGENSNNAMLFFLQERVEVLRETVNPDAGVVLCHHTRKITKKLLAEEPFQALSGASSLRGFYTSGILMCRPDEDRPERKLFFELRNGPAIEPRIVDKVDGQWVEIDRRGERLVRRDHGERLDAERRRKHDVILQLLYDEAAEGRVYTGAQFADRFENQGGLGGKDTIRERLGVLTTKGYVKFFRDHDAYGLPAASRSKFGYLCVEGMHLGPVEESVAPDTGEIVTTAQWVLPTHYKCPQSGAVLPVENPEVWVYLDDGEAVG